MLSVRSVVAWVWVRSCLFRYGVIMSALYLGSVGAWIADQTPLRVELEELLRHPPVDGCSLSGRD